MGLWKRANEGEDPHIAYVAEEYRAVINKLIIKFSQSVINPNGLKRAEDLISFVRTQLVDCIWELKDYQESKKDFII